MKTTIALLALVLCGCEPPKEPSVPVSVALKGIRDVEHNSIEQIEKLQAQIQELTVQSAAQYRQWRITCTEAQFDAAIAATESVLSVTRKHAPSDDLSVGALQNWAASTGQALRDAKGKELAKIRQAQ